MTLTPAEQVSDDAQAVRAAITAARSSLVERELIAEVVALCAVAGEHLLVVGPPGTAKSAAVRAAATQLGGAYFEYLIGRFTEPNEIFGPVDLRRLRDGVMAYETAGMLPTAEIAFLDEVFTGSTAILNTLLGLLNERVFRRGATEVASPLRVCVGAANTLPDDPALLAFADRFLARLYVRPVSDAGLEELLERGWGGSDAPLGPGVMAAVDRLASAARRCELGPVRPLLATALRRLREAGIGLSDRRAVRVQRLVAAAAVLDGRQAAGPAELWVLPLAAPTEQDQERARQVLADLLASSVSGTLGHAAEEYSRGPLARAERLAAAGRRLLVQLDGAAPTRDDRLRLEATLREIDAGFAADDLPEQLRDVRGRLVDLVAP
ncbi:AAA family ATPase [Catellatospora tritici]|uniref:AAA family ATPase n=1 Tax=Catellatospora tritici TaxID=2851566 RepID=UPI001C2DBE75|nr:AAA family ATPase [Catellatospora tritici]MBV1856009.1 AAA family ATPase [Catellatospora tritici]